jgi:hypothetical protein
MSSRRAQPALAVAPGTPEANANARAANTAAVAAGAAAVVNRPKLFWPRWAPESTMGTTILRWVLYSSFAALILFLILLTVHYTIYPILSFSPNDNGLISVPTLSDKKVQFDKSPAGNDASSNFVKVLPCGYTLSMDLYLTGAFAQQTNPRVILYSSATAVKTSTPDVITNFPNTNIVMWLNPDLNDLYISAVTKDPSGSTPPALETAPVITNVPIKTPFRITYVYTTDFIEVYMNGNLQGFLPFQQKPIGLSNSNPFWFGHTSSQASCMVGNVYYWSRILTSNEVKAYGAPVSTVKFFGV